MTDVAIDLFDRGTDPFSPAMLRASDRPAAAPLAGSALLQITVVGTPRPQGSKKAFYNAKLGRALIVDDNDKKLRTWRQDVVSATVAVLRSQRRAALPPGTPLDVGIAFMMPRPKGHWRTGRNAHLLRDHLPARPSSKPDIDKLVRGTLDALRDAGVYVDDSQVVDLHVRKVWANEHAGALIRVETASA